MAVQVMTHRINGVPPQCEGLLRSWSTEISLMNYGKILQEQRERAYSGYLLHAFGLCPPELQVPVRFTQLPFPGHSQDLRHVSRAWTWYCMWDTAMYRVT